MKREIKVGAFALGSLIVFYLGVSYISGSIGFRRNNEYSVIFDSNSGIRNSSPVMFKGTQVGKVTKIEILHDDFYKVKISFEVDAKIALTRESKVKMGHSNIIGLGNASLTLIVEPGKPLKSGSFVSGVVDYTISETITPTIRNVEELLFHTNKFLLEIAKNTDKVSMIFSNLEQITNQVSAIITRNEKTFHGISDMLWHLLKDLNSNETGVRAVLNEIIDLTKNLNANEVNNIISEVNSIVAMLKQIVTYVESGNGTLGTLLKSDDLYQNLIKMVSSGTQLTEDLKLHPQRYVSFSIFGSKSKNK